MPRAIPLIIVLLTLVGCGPPGVWMVDESKGGGTTEWIASRLEGAGFQGPLKIRGYTVITPWYCHPQDHTFLTTTDVTFPTEPGVAPQVVLKYNMPSGVCKTTWQARITVTDTTPGSLKLLVEELWLDASQVIKAPSGFDDPLIGKVNELWSMYHPIAPPVSAKSYVEGLFSQK